MTDRDEVTFQDKCKGNWPTRTIGDLVTLQRGIDLPSQDRRLGKVPIMGSFGITGHHDQARCKGPGVTVGRSGASAGTVSYIEEDYWPLNTCLYVRDFKGNDPRFSYYFLQTFDLARLNSGSAQPSLNRNFIHPLEARFPEPTEQRSIASVLNALNEKIELNRRMNEKLEEMVQAIFRDWFVEFGPVRRSQADATDPIAIMGGLTPDPVHAAELAGLFPADFNDDGLPVGWSEGSLARLARVNSESWKASNHPAEVEYVDLSNTKWGTIETTALLTWEAAPSRARRVAKKGDSIIGTVRPGNGSYAYIGRDGYTVSTGFAVLRPKQAIYTDAIYVAATAADNITRLANLADGHGGAYPAVNPDVVAATPFPIVPDAILRAFSSFASPLREKIEQAKLENTTLAETRDYLLPRLMSGEVRVPPQVEAI